MAVTEYFNDLLKKAETHDIQRNNRGGYSH